jgi:hypothetical protein
MYRTTFVVARLEIMRPAALAEFVLGPEVPEEFEVWGGRGPVCGGRREDDANYVVTEGRRAEPKHTAVCARSAGDLSLLAQVNVGFGGGEPVGGARLDFDEAEGRAFVGDEVDFSLHDCAATVAPDVELEVRGHELVASCAQVFGGELFAAPPEFEVWRDLGGLRGGGCEARARLLK